MTLLLRGAMRARPKRHRGSCGPRLAACITVIPLLLTSWRGFAQQTGCSLPVNVVLHDRSALPVYEADARVARWNRYIRLMRQTSPKWEWAQRWFALGIPSGERLVMMPSEAAVPGLPPEAFYAQDRGRAVAINSVTVERSPRRLVFVTENGKQMTAAGREIEATVISQIVSTARPEDSFGFLTARGPRVDVRLGSSRQTVRKAAGELANPTRDESSNGGVLDAMIEASTWFQPPQPGDSIFVMTLGLEKNHHTSFSTVRAAVAAGGIRVFAFQLASYAVNIASPAYGGPDTSSEFEAFGQNSALRQTLDLARDSGGEIAIEDTEQPHYALNDDRLRHMKDIGELMYHAATQYYALRLDWMDKNLVIGLAPAVQDQYPWGFVFYPRRPSACSGSQAGGSGHR